MIKQVTMVKAKAKQTLPLYKIIMVGSDDIEKLALTLQYMYGDFIEEYDPTKANCTLITTINALN